MTYPIRVLCVMSTLDRGGAESMCMNLYRKIDRRQVQFDFVKHTSAKCAFDEEILSLGGKIYVAPRFRGINIVQYQSWWHNHLKKHPEHIIIHGHYFTASKYYFSVCKKMDRITIGHSHTDSYSRKSIGKRIMIHGVEDCCDYRLACSEKAGNLLYPNKDFIILKNAIEIEKYVFNPVIAKEVREEFGLGDDLILGAVGTIKEVKNPLGMVDILNAVVQQKPNTKLLWVGNDGGMKQQVIEKIENNNLSDRVVFSGVRSDVHRLLQAMDAFLMPSFSEGIPVSMIEAQAAGLPCFVSDAVSREADITNNCCYLPLDDYKKWAQAIMRANLSHLDNYQQIVSAGYEISTTANWMTDFYTSIIREHSGI